MGDLPLRTPTHRRIGGPSHRQLPNAPHGHPFPARRPFLPRRCLPDIYAVLDGVSADYPPGKGRFHTCYSPVRRSPAESANTLPAAPRLACVKPVASVHPEPGSNSSLLLSFQISFFQICPRRHASFRCGRPLNGCLDPSCLDVSFYWKEGPELTENLSRFPCLTCLVADFSVCRSLSMSSRSTVKPWGLSRFASAKLRPFSEPTKYFRDYFMNFFTIR